MQHTLCNSSLPFCEFIESKHSILLPSLIDLPGQISSPASKVCCRCSKLDDKPRYSERPPIPLVFSSISTLYFSHLPYQSTLLFVLHLLSPSNPRYPEPLVESIVYGVERYGTTECSKRLRELNARCGFDDSRRG